MPVAEPFTEDERRRLAPYFTNLDSHVFALTNLPETVKGALFARYSRSAKSLRRLFLDEFADKVAGRRGPRSRAGDVGVERAEKLYARVFNEYGDDSVAQLGGAHIACEYVSNVLTKVLEWGRLMAYLEQSTRYVPYTDKLHGRWRYHVPAELDGAPLATAMPSTMDAAFETYAKWIDRDAGRTSRERYPRSAADSDAVHRAAIRAKALDTLRGMLPAATQSNVGIFGTGQAFEALLLRMRAHPARRSARLRRRMLRRAAQGHPGVPHPRRSARSRRPLERVPRATRASGPRRCAATLVDDVDAEPRTKSR